VIAQEIASQGLKEPVELDELLALGGEGFPESLIIAMTTGARPAAAAASAETAPAERRPPSPR